jgi:hypothetical protein
MLLLHRRSLIEYSEVEKLAKEMDAITKINLSQKWEMGNDWVIDGYTDLCERTVPLTVEEAQRLGSIQIVALLACAREKVQKAIYNDPYRQSMGNGYILGGYRDGGGGDQGKRERNEHRSMVQSVFKISSSTSRVKRVKRVHLSPVLV